MERGLIVAGGLGNLIDRIFRAFVVDYLDVSPLFHFPVFNFADCCVVVGTILLAVWLLVIPLAEMLPFGWPFIPVLLLLMNAVFILYDLALNGLIVFYIRRLHPFVRKYLK